MGFAAFATLLFARGGNTHYDNECWRISLSTGVLAVAAFATGFLAVKRFLKIKFTCARSSCAELTTEMEEKINEEDEALSKLPEMDGPFYMYRVEVLSIPNAGSPEGLSLSLVVEPSVLLYVDVHATSGCGTNTRSGQLREEQQHLAFWLCPSVSLVEKQRHCSASGV